MRRSTIFQQPPEVFEPTTQPMVVFEESPVTTSTQLGDLERGPISKWQWKVWHICYRYTGASLWPLTFDITEYEDL
jgi:hypothetical protein